MRAGLCWVAAAVLATQAAAAAGLPPRSEWQASASAPTPPALAAGQAIDADAKTRWGGAFSAGHWWQLDLGRSAAVGAVRLHWDSAFATGYRILASEDGTRWRTAFETRDGLGGHEIAVFAPVQARWLRLASLDETADSGTSLFEFEPLAAEESPRLAGSAGSAPWQGVQPTRLSVPRLLLELPRPLKLAGLEVDWAAPRRGARLEARDEAGRWHEVDRDTGPQGERSVLAAQAPFVARALRLSVDGPAVLRRLRLLGEDHVATPLARYAARLQRVAPAAAPPVLLARQVYWTVVGVPAARRKALLDEYGSLEPYKGGPMLQPLWRDRAGAVAAQTAKPVHRLREGWMPMPALDWAPREDLQITTEAFAGGTADSPLTLWRHRLVNRGASTAEGDFVVVVHPAQVNPAWQHGGQAALHALRLDGGTLRAGERIVAQALTPPEAAGVAAFAPRTALQHALAGTSPAARQVHDAQGLASALLRWRVRLAPGQSREIVLAVPPAASPLALAPGRFDALADEAAAGWRARLGAVSLTLPEADAAALLRAQAAYILVNQSGPAMQPGPRNYDRSFIRDGSASAIVLARLGLPGAAREYLRWYAAHAVRADGLVSPILDADGSVNRGFGSDIEHDSQGQFVNLVAEIARTDGGPAGVREFEPQVKLALRFLAALRERTLVPGYEAAREAPERFRGLVAPSISHEGYSVPTHSYWDDFWALRGWQDGIWLARAWGDAAFADWAAAQYEALRASVAASVRATMAWKRIDFVPASADLGDPDPTSISIAMDPAGQAELLRADALARTFDGYVAEVARRAAPGSLWAYTPYEWRNVPSLVRLGRARDAQAVMRHLLAGRRPAGWQVMAEVVHSRERFAGYIGDMPHTWVGAEAVRALLALLLRDDADALRLLPGLPEAWLAGEGLALAGLPSSRGRIELRARREGARLLVTLGAGLDPATPVHLAWPGALPPRRVTVDGREQAAFDAAGIMLASPFRNLEATW